MESFTIVIYVIIRQAPKEVLACTRNQNIDLMMMMMTVREHPSPEREFNLTKAVFASSWILNVYILNSHYTNFRWIIYREIEVFFTHFYPSPLG